MNFLSRFYLIRSLRSSFSSILLLSSVYSRVIVGNFYTFIPSQLENGYIFAIIGMETHSKVVIHHHHHPIFARNRLKFDTILFQPETIYVTFHNQSANFLIFTSTDSIRICNSFLYLLKTIDNKLLYPFAHAIKFGLF